MYVNKKKSIEILFEYVHIKMLYIYILAVLWVTKIDECKFQQFQEIKQGIPIILMLKVLFGNFQSFFLLSISRLLVHADAVDFGITNSIQNMLKFAFH